MLNSVENPKMNENEGKTIKLLSDPAMLAPRGTRQMRDRRKMALATAA